MLAVALEAEVSAYVAELADQRDENGRRLVVRNGHQQPRGVTTAAGVVEVLPLLYLIPCGQLQQRGPHLRRTVRARDCNALLNPGR